MKKYFILAAIAITALASCTKDEPAQQDEQKITFATPVVGSLTRADNYVAGEIGTNYDKSEKFTVYGWYCTENSFDPNKCQMYMNGISTHHDATINVDSDEGTQGAWVPDYIYYWPKNGKLTFSAFSPSYASNHVEGLAFDAKTGFTFKEFTTQDDVTTHYDLLYSSRAYNKSTSLGEINTMYDGVDIQFHHALSSIVVNVKADKAYPTGTIAVNEIWFENVYCTADFKENLKTGTETTSSQTAEWSNWSNEKTVTIGNTAITDLRDGTPVKFGSALLIPQAYNHTTDKEVTLKVKYTIKNGDNTTIEQIAEFKLYTNSASYLGSVNGGTATTILNWAKGYRYTYNIAIGLDQIYFAPSVDAWGEVTIAPPQA